MKTNVMEDNQRLRLKQPHGWFAAGEAFNRALSCLSDGAFKLFALMCLRADRHTGRVQATHKELAAALGKSRRAVGSYVAELDRKQVCRVEPAANQHARTSFQIRDDYWPYVTVGACQPALDPKVIRLKNLKQSFQPKAAQSNHSPAHGYVESVRASFLAIGCGRGSFSPSDEQAARQFEKNGVPLETVKDALVLGSVRKYVSWLNGSHSPPVGSLNYFEGLIQELQQQQQPWPADFREYLRSKHWQFARRWNELSDSSQTGQQTGSVPNSG